MNRVELLENLIRLSEEFMALEDPKSDFEESTSALEAFIEKREIFVQELGPIDNDDNPVLKQRLFDLDLRVTARIKDWMADIKKELKLIQSQKEATVKVKRSKGGYARSTPSTEGYFIDRKK